MGILTTQNVFDDGVFVSLRFIGFDISAAQRPEVVQHDIDGDIKGWLARSQRGLVRFIIQSELSSPSIITPDRDAKQDGSTLTGHPSSLGSVAPMLSNTSSPSTMWKWYRGMDI